MKLINLKHFKPSTAGETAALVAYVALEPNNPPAFTTTYHHAYRRGLPVNLFYQFTSEIKQDSTIRNKGAIFNKKVAHYFEARKK